MKNKIRVAALLAISVSAATTGLGFSRCHAQNTNEEVLQAALDRAARIAELKSDVPQKTLYLFWARAHRYEKTAPDASAALYSLAAQTLWEYAAGTGFENGSMNVDLVFDSIMLWTGRSLKPAHKKHPVSESMQKALGYRALDLMQQMRRDFPGDDKAARMDKMAVLSRGFLSDTLPDGAPVPFTWQGLTGMRYTAKIYREMAKDPAYTLAQESAFPYPLTDSSLMYLRDSCCAGALPAAEKMAAEYDSGRDWKLFWPILRSYYRNDGGFALLPEQTRSRYETTLTVCESLSRIPYPELSRLDAWKKISQTVFAYMGQQTRNDFRRMFWADPEPDTLTMVPAQDKIRLMELCKTWPKMEDKMEAAKELAAYRRMIARKEEREKNPKK